MAPRRMKGEPRCYKCSGFRDVLSWMSYNIKQEEALRRQRRARKRTRRAPQHEEVTVEEFSIEYDEFDV